MGKALYRKYRSKKLSEIVGQEHITKTLENALQHDKVSHAYLFTGPRGVGKTSVARILAHEINGLSYADDTQHIDIIEIDAASNRRIDEIRDLRDKVHIAPTSAKYKVYIIDEVHMLTREAFNALLKTLEEPPAHVIFILATTDAHKLPETIVSRTQRFAFRPISVANAVKLLEKIAKKEKISIDQEALKLLAEHAEGSLRDSTSLLDQARNYGDTITASTIQNMIGLPSAESIDELLHAITVGDPAQIMQTLNALYESGYPAPIIAKELSRTLRSDILSENPAIGSDKVITLLTDLLGVANASQPAQYLELMLLKTSSNKTEPNDAQNSTRKENLSLENPPVKPAQSTTPPKVTDEAKAEEKDTRSDNKKAKKMKAEHGKSIPFDLHIWSQVLDALKKRHNTLYGVIRMAEPILLDEHNLQLNFAFAFHQKRISEPANRQILIGIIKEISGNTLSVECVHNKQASPPALPTSSPRISEQKLQKKSPAKLDTISNIFGGGELLES